MFNILTFVFIVLIISSNACTSEVNLRAVIRDFFAKTDYQITLLLVLRGRGT